jgi:hypothetical protein
MRTRLNPMAILAILFFVALGAQCWFIGPRYPQVIGVCLMWIIGLGYFGIERIPEDDKS